MNLENILALAAPLAPLFTLCVFIFFPRAGRRGMAAGAALSGLCVGWGLHLHLPALTLAGLSSAAVAAYEALFNRFRKERHGAWRARRNKMEDLKAEEEKSVAALKKEWDRAEREISRTLRLYGTMKGLGEALTWEEMTPHIDYAVQQCLGFKEYQLYLIDESSAYQKMLSRGFRLQEPPFEALSGTPKLHKHPTEVYLEVPIRQNDQAIGFIWGRVSNNANVASSLQLSADDLLLEAQGLAEGLGVGLQKARLFSSIEKLSRIDGLTGTFRRQIFNDRLDEEIRRSAAFRTVFSVLIADLDHFKHINDTYGHQAGDEVLRRVGKLFKEGVYETDFVARYGGEEFVILFPQGDPAGVLRKAEALRRKVADEVFEIGWNKLQVTVSMGIAHYPQDGMDPKALLEASDRRLYAAKEGGRNRVVYA